MTHWIEAGLIVWACGVPVMGAFLGWREPFANNSTEAVALCVFWPVVLLQSAGWGIGQWIGGWRR